LISTEIEGAWRQHVTAGQVGSTNEADQPPTPSRAAVYLITVRGGSAAGWSAWTGAAAVDNGDGTVTLTAVVDQAALRGMLGRLWDLNATLISTAWVPSDHSINSSIDAIDEDAAPEEGAGKEGIHDG
jgi:hypothetical protein